MLGIPCSNKAIIQTKFRSFRDTGLAVVTDLGNGPEMHVPPLYRSSHNNCFLNTQSLHFSNIVVCVELALVEHHYCHLEADPWC
jgi:hypothetical protein